MNVPILPVCFSLIVLLFFSSCAHVPTLEVAAFQSQVLGDLDKIKVSWYYVGSDSNFDYFKRISASETKEVRVEIAILPLPTRRMYSTDDLDWFELYPKN